MTLNIEQARFNMIDNQVRVWDVLNPDVLAILKRIPREDFVPPAYRNMAFADLTLPLGHGEVMLKPVVEGRILQELALENTETVLEIGTGTGFLSACLAGLAKKVDSVEQHADFTDTARANLARAKVTNVNVTTADAFHGYQPEEHYDVIVVGGAVATVPERFLAWLKPAGRAFMVVGQSPAMDAVIIRPAPDGSCQQRSLFETDLPYLAHAAPVPHFTF